MAEGNQVVVEAVIEQRSAEKMDEAASGTETSDSGTGNVEATSAGASGEENGGGAGDADYTDDQLHTYAGHDTSDTNCPLYGDREPVGNYEYLDHTADVQLHSWGSTLEESFEAVVLAMFDYMTDISSVEKTITREVCAEGDDMKSLLYHFLDEWLFVFSTDPFFIPREVKVTEFDAKNFTIKSTGHGEYFDLVKHPQGTEVKAITYSNMQIHEEKDTHDMYVIIDI